MTITKTMAFKVGEQTFGTFEEAQLHSLTMLFFNMKSNDACGASAEGIAAFSLDHADEIVEILTCQPDQEKPARKPRSDKGKKRALSETEVEREVTNQP